MSVERMPPNVLPETFPADARVGVGWAVTVDGARVGVFLAWPDGSHHFSEGPGVEPGLDVSLWCSGVLGILERHGEIGEADIVPLLEIARDFYAPRGLWHAGCVTRG